MEIINEPNNKLPSLNRDYLDWEKVSEFLKNIASRYRSSWRTIIRNKWIFLIPLFSVILNSLYNIFWLYRFEPQFFQSQAFEALKEQHAMFFSTNDNLLSRFLWPPIDQVIATIIDSLFLTGLVSVGLGLVAALFFIRPLLRALKNHYGIVTLLLVSLLGMGASMFLLFYPLGNLSLFRVQGISSALFSLPILAMGLGVFLVYIQNTIQNRQDLNTTQTLFATAIRCIIPILLTFLFAAITSPNWWYAPFNVNYPAYILTAIHGVFMIASLFVPFIAVMENSGNFLAVIKKSVAIVARFPKHTLVFISINFLVFILLMLTRDFITNPGIFGNLYIWLFQLFLYDTLLMANTLVLAITLMSFVIEKQTYGDYQGTQ